MARILSVSYDVSLLGTRQMILQNQGHEVVSALGFTEALKQCQSSKKFDLFILGHSIPHSDKRGSHFGIPSRLCRSRCRPN